MILKIDWVEATVTDQRVELTEENKGKGATPHYVTVGHLVHEDDEFYLLARDKNNVGYYRELSAIPKVLVTKVTPLKETTKTTDTAIITWKDANYLLDSTSRSKELAIKRCSYTTFEVIGKVFFKNKEKIEVFNGWNADINKANNVHTLPMRAVTKIKYLI